MRYEGWTNPTNGRKSHCRVSYDVVVGTWSPHATRILKLLCGATSEDGRADYPPTYTQGCVSCMRLAVKARLDMSGEGQL